MLLLYDSEGKGQNNIHGRWTQRASLRKAAPNMHRFGTAVASKVKKSLAGGPEGQKLLRKPLLKTLVGHGNNGFFRSEPVKSLSQVKAGHILISGARQNERLQGVALLPAAILIWS